MIANLFNKYFSNIDPTIDKSIPKAKSDFRNDLKNIKINKTFFLTPPEEMVDIIVSLDEKKSLGPNSIPICILKRNL